MSERYEAVTKNIGKIILIISNNNNIFNKIAWAMLVLYMYVCACVRACIRACLCRRGALCQVWYSKTWRSVLCLQNLYVNTSSIYILYVLEVADVCATDHKDQCNDHGMCVSYGHYEFACNCYPKYSGSSCQLGITQWILFTTISCLCIIYILIHC